MKKMIMIALVAISSLLMVYGVIVGFNIASWMQKQLYAFYQTPAWNVLGSFLFLAAITLTIVNLIASKPSVQEQEEPAEKKEASHIVMIRRGFD